MLLNLHDTMYLIGVAVGKDRLGGGILIRNRRNPPTGKSVTQFSAGINGSVGLGLILQGSVKIPFYKIREKK